MQPDTLSRYGTLSRAFHWATAALMLWQFFGMGLRALLGRHPLVSSFVSTHALVGTLLFVLVAARLLWASRNRKRRPQPQGQLARLAQLGHAALYTLMLVVPALALLRAAGSTRGLSLLGLELFPARAEEIAWMVAPANALHGALAWLLGVMILGHISAALFHQRVAKDGTLARMV